MIEKIISSGISGCEAGILKLASKYRIKTMGYTSLELDNGEIPEHLSIFNLEHADSQAEADKKNMDISDGVLFLSDDEIPSDLYMDIKEEGRKKGLSFFRINVLEEDIYKKAEMIRDWIIENGIVNLMVKDELKDSSEKMDVVTNMIESLIYMVLMKTDPENLASPIHVKTPDYKSGSDSVESVVTDLVKTIPLKDRVIISNMGRDEIYDLFPALGVTILSKYYWPANNFLKNDCLRISGGEEIEEFEIVEIIILKLWEKLRDTHKLRVLR